MQYRNRVCQDGSVDEDDEWHPLPSRIDEDVVREEIRRLIREYSASADRAARRWRVGGDAAAKTKALEHRAAIKALQRFWRRLH